MKKILLLTVGYLLSQSILAQEPSDALRFSWTVPSGTARQQAIGGAMGSLGGDISAAYVNPAGLAFYKTGDFVFSPIYQVQRAKGSYLGYNESEVKRKMLWGTTGFVTGSGGNGRKVKSTSFALAYNRSADFNSNFTYKGANNTSSYSQKYLEEIAGDKSGNSVNVNYPFGASLAFRTLWIDTVGGGTEPNFDFQSRSQNILTSAGLLQRQTFQSRGGIHEFAIAGAINLNDKVMLGGTLGIPVLSYHRNTQFAEADATENSSNQFNFATVDEDIDVSGAGINLKAGVIFKPEEYWRIGFAFHTPTLYSLTDHTMITVTADVESADGTLFTNNEDITGAPSEFKYTFTSPYRAIASVSYVLRETQDISQQKGFLTADIEYVNYKASSYEPDQESAYDTGTTEYLKSLNRAIDNAYKGAFNIRAGGELKFTTFMVRAGAAYYGNPYQNINGEKGSKLNLSGGIGYRDKGFFADLTYVHSIQKDTHFPYRLIDPSQYYGAQIKSNVGNVLMTVGLKF
ncbi:aromatic hydrocarbon degradation protein [Chitinophagaceae bacterium LB-8]|uniref:Aromatic hydrocarbon degradation protein n=1 Tax=Paraflavisolibacter caeni TaxID=2982496 RepID=A0A9X2XTV6_9BACT|nr:aromatic hydrocarbon degradation protein [Paraflavisolibacter caeni]MCU7548951.1 aromatic hydrocarbon degradation protein [Paraflavisolibacter caeni]